jgi:hypothetical protein
VSPTYIVVGPERAETIPVLPDGSGPTEIVHDVYWVSAPTKHAAKWAAWRRARERGDLWYSDLGDEHPLANVTAEVTDERACKWPRELVVWSRATERDVEAMLAADEDREREHADLDEVLVGIRLNDEHVSEVVRTIERDETARLHRLLTEGET